MRTTETSQATILSSAGPPRVSGAVLFGAAFCIWTVFGIVEGCQYYFIRSLGAGPVSWEHAFRVSVPRMWVWALLTPAIVWATRWIARGGVVRSLTLHLLSAIAFSLLGLSVGAVVYFWTANDAGTPLGRLFPAYFAAHSAVAIIAYLAVTGGFYAHSYYERFRQRDMEASRLRAQTARLEARLSQSRLRLLREQLQPHFLFNTLHAISTLVLKGQSERAIRMIARLSDFLRLSLDQPLGQLVPLAQELEALDRYLEIQAERFGDRLEIERDLEPASRRALVPSLLLQPLAENAIRHGIEQMQKRGLIRLRTSVQGEAVTIRVEDNGPGFSGTGTPREGVGLRNTRLRLQELYGEDASLRYRNGALGGASVEVVLPLRIAGASSGFADAMDNGPGLSEAAADRTALP